MQINAYRLLFRRLGLLGPRKNANSSAMLTSDRHRENRAGFVVSSTLTQTQPPSPPPTAPCPLSPANHDGAGTCNEWATAAPMAGPITQPAAWQPLSSEKAQVRSVGGISAVLRCGGLGSGGRGRMSVRIELSGDATSNGRVIPPAPHSFTTH